MAETEIIVINDENETHNTNIAFIDPSQEIEIIGEKALKCETCDFTARRQSFIMKHKEEKHKRVFSMLLKC